MKEIAEILGVSTGTVSKGLNGANDISEELRKKIIDTAIAVGYTTKKMRNKVNSTLCVFVENVDYHTTNQFGYELIMGFKQAALRNDFNVEIVNCSLAIQEKESYDAYMIRRGFRGAFFIGFRLNDPWINDLNKTTIPTVILDNLQPENPNVASIGTDNTQALRSAIEHLSNLGHTRIGFLNGDSDSMISIYRTEAFEKACKQFDIVLFEGQIQYTRFATEDVQTFVERFHALELTAIMCSSDQLALAAIDACHHLALHVPDDLSIIGFDDLPISAHITPALTTINQDRSNLGRIAFSSLDSLMQQIPISQTLLRPSLVIRDSVSSLKDC